MYSMYWFFICQSTKQMYIKRKYKKTRNQTEAGFAISAFAKIIKNLDIFSKLSKINAKKIDDEI